MNKRANSPPPRSGAAGPAARGPGSTGDDATDRVAQDAEYIAQMAISLAQLAREHDLAMLGYFLEMSAMQAASDLDGLRDATDGPPSSE
jgi:hypothetical protein